jgi:hypothetical protein
VIAPGDGPAPRLPGRDGESARPSGAGVSEGAPTPRAGSGRDGESARPSGPGVSEGAPTPNLTIDINGDWFDDGVEVTHPGILANLRGNLRRDAEGYFVQTRVRIPVQVQDVPWVVVRLERRAERLHAVLNDGTECDVDPATLRLGPGDVPYCAVRDGAFEARLSRAAAFQLLGLAQYDEPSGEGRLRVGGREIVLRKPR